MVAANNSHGVGSGMAHERPEVDQDNDPVAGTKIKEATKRRSLAKQRAPQASGLSPAKHELLAWVPKEDYLPEHQGVWVMGVANSVERLPLEAQDRHRVPAGNYQARLHRHGSEIARNCRQVLFVLATYQWTFGRNFTRHQRQCIV
jgi:hypothetical protein